MSYLQPATPGIPENHTTGTMYFVQSYAKINLTLDVLGRRSDGYHDLATIMQTIDLYDTICLTATTDDTVQMICSRSELSNSGNLALRAAEAVRQRLGLTRGLVIELHKRIPVAAGLGGGSSNAATILRALQQWWNLPLSSEDLLELAAGLGSDVPFFLEGSLALCTGRGEKIVPLVPNWPMAMRWLLLLKPAIGVSTATVFRSLSPGDYSDGHYSRTVQTALQEKRSLQLEHLHNCLERGVLEQYPEVAQAHAAILTAGAAYVRLSGSGPTLFTSFTDLTEATTVQQRLQTQGYEVYLTRAHFPTNTTVNYF